MEFVASSPHTKRPICGIVKRVYKKQRKLEWVWGSFKGIHDPKDPLYPLTVGNHWLSVDHWGIQLHNEVAWRAGPRVTLPSSLAVPEFTAPIPVARAGTELFCGSGHLSDALEGEGYRMHRYDRKQPDGAPRSCNTEWGALSVDALRWLFAKTVLHMSPDCSTFSQLATSVHKRNRSNDFLGTSSQAFVANGHLLKLFDALRARVFAPHSPLVYTIENPEATFEYHAFSKEVCRPVEEGGCGGKVVRVSFCAFGGRVRKNTVILTNSSTLYALAGNGEFYCGSRRRCAFHKGMVHECVTVRNKLHNNKMVVTGHATKDVTAFPILMAQFMAKAIDVDVAKLDGVFQRCDSTQCAFSLGHTGLCSHMMVTSARDARWSRRPA